MIKLNKYTSELDDLFMRLKNISTECFLYLNGKKIKLIKVKKLNENVINKNNIGKIYIEGKTENNKNMSFCIEDLKDDIELNFEVENKTRYICIGVGKNGKKFRMEVFNPWDYNFYKCNIWEDLGKGRKKLIKKIDNTF